MAAGWFHTVLLRDDGSAIAYGRDSGGCCDLSLPPNGARYVGAAAGFHSTLLLDSEGRVTAFGKNTSRQSDVPSLPEGLRYTAMATSEHHSAFLRSDGHVVTAGSNFWGQCTVPDLVLPPGAVYEAVAVGIGHTVLLLSTGKVWAFGRSQEGQCDVPDLPVGMRYTAVAAGVSHTVLLRSDGVVLVRGDVNVSPILEPPDGLQYVAVAAGSQHVVLLLSNGQAVAFGHNGCKQCDVPVLAVGLRYVGVSAGCRHTVLFRSDGHVLAFGWNLDRQCDVPELPPHGRYIVPSEDVVELVLRSALPPPSGYPPPVGLASDVPSLHGDSYPVSVSPRPRDQDVAQSVERPQTSRPQDQCLLHGGETLAAGGGSFSCTECDARGSSVTSSQFANCAAPPISILTRPQGCFTPRGKRLSFARGVVDDARRGTPRNISVGVGQAPTDAAVHPAVLPGSACRSVSWTTSAESCSHRNGALAPAVEAGEHDPSGQRSDLRSHARCPNDEPSFGRPSSVSARAAPAPGQSDPDVLATSSQPQEVPGVPKHRLVTSASTSPAPPAEPAAIVGALSTPLGCVRARRSSWHGGALDDASHGAPLSSSARAAHALADVGVDLSHASVGLHHAPTVLARGSTPSANSSRTSSLAQYADLQESSWSPTFDRASGSRASTPMGSPGRPWSSRTRSTSASRSVQDRSVWSPQARFAAPFLGEPGRDILNLQDITRTGLKYGGTFMSTQSPRSQSASPHRPFDEGGLVGAGRSYFTGWNYDGVMCSRRERTPSPSRRLYEAGGSIVDFRDMAGTGLLQDRTCMSTRRTSASPRRQFDGGGGVIDLSDITRVGLRKGGTFVSSAAAPLPWTHS